MAMRPRTDARRQLASSVNARFQVVVAHASRFLVAALREVQEVAGNQPTLPPLVDRPGAAHCLAYIKIVNAILGGNLLLHFDHVSEPGQEIALVGPPDRAAIG